jgi:hypothetical protein
MYLIDAGKKHDREDIGLLNEFRLYLADLDFKNRKAFVNQEQKIGPYNNLHTICHNIINGSKHYCKYQYRIKENPQ